MTDPDQIEVLTETVGTAIVVRPQGEIDLSRSPTFRTYLNQAVGDSDDRVIVDLAEVPYMDSSGVATLVEAMQSARQASSKLILCGMKEKVRSIFEIARLDMVFTIVDSMEDAQTA